MIELLSIQELEKAVSHETQVTDILQKSFQKISNIICFNSKNIKNAEELFRQESLKNKPNLGFYACVIHQVVHVYDIKLVKEIAYESKKKAHSYINREYNRKNSFSRKISKQLFILADTIHDSRYSVIISEQKTWSNKFYPQANHQTNSSAVAVKQKRLSRFKDKSGRLPGTAQLSHTLVSDTYLLEYYGCFRKALYVMHSEALYAMKRNHSSELDKVNVYLCTYCTGYHVGHLTFGTKVSTVRNARKHWKNHPTDADQFLAYKKSVK